MIDPKVLLDEFSKFEIDHYFGVPDSLLKDFCAFVDDNALSGQHVITSNEGNAVAMAAGYHFASNRTAVVYMQNSGLGNSINPLVSLADKEVYKIPLLLIIGWRGEPGYKDEPQHIKQGKITKEQLELLGIPYIIVDSSSDPALIASSATNLLKQTQAPVALLVRKGSFLPYKSKKVPSLNTNLRREEALSLLLDLAADSPVISTTGKTSREVFELRDKKQQLQRDFLTVGGMGHTSSIALGAAIAQPNKQFICIDGDGSALMHLGAIPIIGSLGLCNFIHVLLNNSAHESVGGQPTVADQINFDSLVKSCGYKNYFIAHSLDEIRDCWQLIQSQEVGPIMLEVRISIGSRDDLGRPTTTPLENKISFMNWVQK